MTRHPIDTAALRIIHRMKADENLKLTDARKYGSDGSGWERIRECERRIRIFADMIQAVETLPDD